MTPPKRKPPAIQRGTTGRRPAARGAIVVLLVVGVIAAAGIGAAIAVLVLMRPPTALDEPAALVQTSVSSQAFTDPRTVKVAYSVIPAIDLASPAAGRVTAATCLPDAVIDSGGSAFSIDGVPILHLHTSVPLWRSLRVGDTGEDVRALESELSRLGYLTDSDDYFGWATADAVDAAFAAIGDDSGQGALSIARVLWLPAVEVQILTCDVVPGSWVAAGGRLASLPPAVRNASIISGTGDALLPGDREVEVDGRVLLVEPDLTITDPASLQVLARLTASANSSSADAQALTGSLRLREPIQIAAVPPGALFGIEDGRACVSSGGRVIALEIVGSQLGATFVVFDGPAPERVDVRPTARPCP